MTRSCALLLLVSTALLAALLATLVWPMSITVDVCPITRVDVSKTSWTDAAALLEDALLEDALLEVRQATGVYVISVEES